jgi:hypothetical protein
VASIMVVPRSKEIQWFHNRRYAHLMNSSVRWRAYAKPGAAYLECWVVY